MQSFVETNREEPDKTDVSRRIKNFEEIYRFFSNRKVARQAERCVQCGDPFCTTIGCPLQNHIPQWLEAIADRDLERAFQLSNESSPFPEILGRVCPQGHLCEGACTLDDGYGAITIGAIEASITDLAFKAGLELPFPGVRHPQTVAIVGSGPAGMACAHFLLRAGIGVVMYEQADRPGGLLTYGIPGFKLDKTIVEKRFAILRDAGLKLHLQQQVGRDVELSWLVDNHAAVFLASGAWKARRAGIEGEELESVYAAMDYLTAKQRQLFGHAPDPRFELQGKRVVVIGGGDTAMDCLRTAVRDGAEEVICLYRRNQENMPGSPKEFHNAIEEGVEFNFNISPRKLSRGNGTIRIEAERTRLGEKESDGRQRVEIVPDSAFSLPADCLIMALGFDVAEIPGGEELGIKTDRWGQIIVDPATGQTHHEKIYSGGDCYRGADLVVTAAADGRRAALTLMGRLLGD